jgi:hypothetical protein
MVAPILPAPITIIFFILSPSINTIKLIVMEVGVKIKLFLAKKVALYSHYVVHI